MQKAKSRSTNSQPKGQAVMSLEDQILKFGLNSEPTSANVVAKRLHMRESPKNVSMLKKLLDKLTSEKKVYRCGSRYAIDYRGAKNLMDAFCVKISDGNYKIDNYAFYHIG